MSTMYTLTAMTGKEASANRTVVIGTIEFNWRVWMILVWCAPLALITTVILWVVIGQIALIAIPLVEGAAVWLIHRRTSHGLKLRTYQALWDKKKADLNTFMLCARKIEVTETDYRILMPNTVSYVPPEPAPGDAYVDHLLAKPVPAGVVPVAELDRPALASTAARGVGRPQIARPQPAQPAQPYPTHPSAPVAPTAQPSIEHDVSAWFDQPAPDLHKDPQ